MRYNKKKTSCKLKESTQNKSTPSQSYFQEKFKIGEIVRVAKNL